MMRMRMANDVVRRVPDIQLASLPSYAVAIATMCGVGGFEDEGLVAHLRSCILSSRHPDLQLASPVTDSTHLRRYGGKTC